jgi:hypothetical protein
MLLSLYPHKTEMELPAASSSPIMLDKKEGFCPSPQNQHLSTFGPHLIIVFVGSKKPRV